MSNTKVSSVDSKHTHKKHSRNGNSWRTPPPPYSVSVFSTGSFVQSTSGPENTLHHPPPYSYPLSSGSPILGVYDDIISENASHSAQSPPPQPVVQNTFPVRDDREMTYEQGETVHLVTACICFVIYVCCPIFVLYWFI